MGAGEHRRKVLRGKWATEIKSDTLTYADGLTNKSNGAREIFRKITTMENKLQKKSYKLY